MGSRRPNISRDELHDLFVEAGRSILREEGLGGGGELITFKRAIDRVEAETGIHVTNASLIGRVWENQSDFQTDVLATIAADPSTSEIREMVASLTPVLAAMDPDSEESRRATMRQVCRVAAAANTDALRRSTDWSLWIGMWAVTAIGSAPERRQRVEQALRQSYEGMTDHMERLYRWGNDFVGYRVRDGLTLRQFTIAVAALAEGCVLRDRVDSSHMNGIRRPTGPDGSDQEWTLFGLALEAMVGEFLELDPDWLPPATQVVVGDVFDV